MGQIVLGMGSSHSPQLSTPAEYWKVYGEGDRNNHGLVDTTATGDAVQEYAPGTDINTLGLPTGTAVISPGINGVMDTTPAADDELRFGYVIGTNGLRVPIPAITLPVNPIPVTLEWDLSTGKVSVDGGTAVGGIAGMTGDGVLSSATDKGTFEHIAFTNVTADAAVLIDVHIDCFGLKADALIDSGHHCEHIDERDRSAERVYYILE
ncbi:MAG: hypothetical protein IIB17_09315 [Chloroflexi bacterium]|nr:hypothetical protein [Chloroflexota bacterium]